MNPEKPFSTVSNLYNKDYLLIKFFGKKLLWLRLDNTTNNDFIANPNHEYFPPCQLELQLTAGYLIKHQPVELCSSHLLNIGYDESLKLSGLFIRKSENLELITYEEYQAIKTLSILSK